jgi:hypothetical protein
MGTNFKRLQASPAPVINRRSGISPEQQRKMDAVFNGALEVIARMGIYRVPADAVQVQLFKRIRPITINAPASAKASKGKRSPAIVRLPPEQLGDLVEFTKAQQAVLGTCGAIRSAAVNYPEMAVADLKAALSVGLGMNPSTVHIQATKARKSL